MRWVCKAAAGLAAALAVALTPAIARAGGEAIDASYGRVDGDATLVGGLGAALAARGARLAADVRVRYLETAGLFATYEEAEALGQSLGPARLLAAGMEVRPLFLFRWLQGHEVHVPRLDLTLDSIGLDLGAVFAQPAGGDFASRVGLQVGLGVEVPVLPRASGPWVGVRAALRWSDAAMGSGVAAGAEDRELVVSLTLAWHQVVGAHVVDLGDRAP